MEFGVKFNFDDGGISDKIAQQGRDLEKFSKLWKEYEKQATQASKATANELINTEKELANMAVTMAQNATEIEKSFSTIRKEIGTVALAIAGSIPNSEKFVSTIEKLKNAKLNGVAIDLETVEAELTNIVSEAKLTDDQFRLLVNNIDEVANAVVAVTDGSLPEVAASAEKLTTEFTSAKKELRDLNNLINSDQLEGEALQKAIERAAELTDKIGDNRDEIKRLSSDTRGFDLLADGVKTIGAGFQVAQGAASLFGDESEDVQKALLKLNSIMAVSAGLSQLAEQATQKGTLANKAAAFAQGLYGTVVGTSTGALKLFRLALAATGIGLIVILIGALVANWDKVKGSVGGATGSFLKWTKGVTEGIPFIGKITSGISWMYDNFEKLTSVISGAGAASGSFFKNTGKAISQLFSGDFSKAYDTFQNIGENSAKAFNDGFKNAETTRIDTAQVESILKTQKAKLEVMEAGGRETNNLQKSILANELKLLNLQSASKEDIAAKEQEIAVNNARVAKENADKAKEAKDKELEKFKEYLSDLSSLQSELKNIQRDNIDDSTDEGKIAKIKANETIDIEALNKQKETTLAKIDDLKKKAELTEVYLAIENEIHKKYTKEIQDVLDDATKRFQQDNDERSQEWEKRVASEKEAADKAKQTLLDDNDERIKYLTEINNARKNSEIQRIDDQLKYGNLSIEMTRKLELDKLIEIKKGIDERLEAKKKENPYSVEVELLQSQSDSLKAELESKEQELGTYFDNFGDFIKNKLTAAFGLSGEQGDALIEGFDALKNAIFDVINSGYEAELAAIDDVIDQRKDKISDLEGLIKEEYEAKQNGYANNYDSLVKQKSDEEALLKADNAKKLKIQKDQLAATTAIQAAQQASALITAVANVTAEGSKLGIFGIPLIIAGIIGMFAIFKSYKAQATALSKAYKGGKVSDYLDYQTSGRTDKGQGRGHHVEDTNMVIGANEFIMNENSTNANLPFLRAMNSGHYDNVNLMSLLKTKSDGDHLKEYEQNRRKAIIIQENHINVAIEKAIEKQTTELRFDFERQTKALLEADSRKPVVIPLPSGATKIIYYENNSIRTEIIKPN